jgi:RNA polymerase sigma factor (sigma-70 family)
VALLMHEGGAAPDGDQAIAAIYAREGTRLVALARVLCGDADAGEDLAQEVFVRALRATARDPEYLREPAWPWLRTTLVRLVIERRRRLLAELRRMVRVYEPQPPTEWPAETADVASAVAALPPRMRACVVLRYCEDLSTLEVAQTLGCAPATVVVQLRTARERLRLRLAPEMLDAPDVGEAERG